MIAQPRPRGLHHTVDYESAGPHAPNAGNLRGRVFRVECRSCAYEPCEQGSIPTTQCPKCHCTAWRRIPLPGALLAAAGAGWPAGCAPGRPPGPPGPAEAGDGE